MSLWVWFFVSIVLRSCLIQATLSSVLFTLSAAVLLFVRAQQRGEQEERGDGVQEGGGVHSRQHTCCFLFSPTRLPVGDSLAGGMRFPSFVTVSLSVPQNSPLSLPSWTVCSGSFFEEVVFIGQHRFCQGRLSW